MILARVEASRSFVGSLDAKSDLVESLQLLCKDKGIDCALISGYGYIEDPVMQTYSRSEKGRIAPVSHEGCFVVPTVSGSISVNDRNQPEVLLFAMGSAAGRNRSKALSGQVVSATVLQFEFVIQTVDNVVLHRIKDRGTGLELWLQMLPAGIGGRPLLEDVDLGDGVVEEEEEDYIDEELEISAGDWLNHPRLGMCHVVHFDGEDRIKVKLQSGRIAELMMTMFKLSLDGVREGGKVFKVTVRKRR
jgi:predicted DNA-binding protein with PD1-like motif